jgi:hypothetical protein
MNDEASDSKVIGRAGLIVSTATGTTSWGLWNAGLNRAAMVAGSLSLIYLVASAGYSMATYRREKRKTTGAPVPD